MGLFDDPVGFLFGGDDEGVVDRRASRTPEGQRWWQKWEETFGDGGPMDPTTVYPKALAALDSLMGWRLGQVVPGGSGASSQTLYSATLARAPVRLRMDGNDFTVTPRWARELPFRYVSALSSLMNPWLRGGLELERGRYGTPYHTNSGGLLGGLLGNMANSAGSIFGRGLGGWGAGAVGLLG